MEWKTSSEKIKENLGLVILGGVGLILLLIGGVWWIGSRDSGVDVEVLGESTMVMNDKGQSKFVDVEGAVVRPGVYEASSEARLKDVLSLAGGLSDKADREYVAKKMNLASKVSDGMKIYIPMEGEEGVVSSGVSSNGSAVNTDSIGGVVNVNTASVSELDSLWGVGASRAQQIVEGRPYEKIEDLLSKKVVPSNVFERIKGQISVN